MYLTITPQKLSQNYSQSVSYFVSYLEKENKSRESGQLELFFNQYGENLNPSTVIQEIDANTAKLNKIEPKYYSITINPSRHELKHVGNNIDSLKKYTREVMKEYARTFNREINGKPINITDIKYFAKVEHQRSFKGTDREIKENAPYVKEIKKLENKIRKVSRGEIKGNIRAIEKELHRLKLEAPHKINGEIIRQGMGKEGLQTHIHIIVSRKDASNSYSLSPGSKYRSSEVMMHGKIVKRGFERDQFFEKAEKTFDKLFGYNRNYVESYLARKTFIKQPKQYYAHLNTLSVVEKRIAFQILGQTGISIPHLNITPNQLSFALKHLKKALEVGIRSSSIGY
ncbi:hypothetical protein GCM10007103_13080 [Salinimicrobium marinum]|uniref:Mobilization protein n=1 Tax=Salinimicrobium marinum TaxID=680283 RepID=A0A918VXJ8_9FLAO|nr:MobB family relaxase [Salinimicrobium marinum]GHA33016.1 hypothetical protein GCM10007103_13080 [Salinimicrobium marinum]